MTNWPKFCRIGSKISFFFPCSEFDNLAIMEIGDELCAASNREKTVWTYRIFHKNLESPFGEISGREGKAIIIILSPRPLFLQCIGSKEPLQLNLWHNSKPISAAIEVSQIFLASFQLQKSVTFFSVMRLFSSFHFHNFWKSEKSEIKITVFEPIKKSS